MVTVNTRKIRSLMTERGLSTNSLANRCGLAPSCLHYLFKRAGRCRIETAVKIANGLNTPVSLLICKKSAAKAATPTTQVTSTLENNNTIADEKSKASKEITVGTRLFKLGGEWLTLEELAKRLPAVEVVNV